eukprot:TRINITY_DN2638_c0_g2_i1.p1 TRINITY_DN2638_c0_g2~~TRINITY_DN2638_c0_g2_i1.p1  ORF type:complete len:431 (-),score=64.20 TRINITY_DN2638_c0_g2_i1:376-1614(-)
MRAALKRPSASGQQRTSAPGQKRPRTSLNEETDRRIEDIGKRAERRARKADEQAHKRIREIQEAAEKRIREIQEAAEKRILEASEQAQAAADERADRRVQEAFRLLKDAADKRSEQAETAAKQAVATAERRAEQAEAAAIQAVAAAERRAEQAEAAADKRAEQAETAAKRFEAATDKRADKAEEWAQQLLEKLSQRSRAASPTPSAPLSPGFEREQGVEAAPMSRETEALRILSANVEDIFGCDDPAEIMKERKRLAKLFHPDKLHGAQALTVQMCTAAFSKVNRAFEEASEYFETETPMSPSGAEVKVVDSTRGNRVVQIQWCNSAGPRNRPTNNFVLEVPATVNEQFEPVKWRYMLRCIPPNTTLVTLDESKENIARVFAEADRFKRLDLRLSAQNDKGYSDGVHLSLSL